MSGTSHHSTSYTQQDIARYLRGELSSAEMHAMEKAALNDPFLADAMEGFREADPSVAAAHLAAIRAELQQPRVATQTEQPEKRTQSWWRIAAAVLLIAGASTIGWLVLRNDTPESVLAERKAFVATPATPANDSAIAKADKTTVAAPENTTASARDNVQKKEAARMRGQEALAPAAPPPPPAIAAEANTGDGQKERLTELVIAASHNKANAINDTNVIIAANQRMLAQDEAKGVSEMNQAAANKALLAARNNIKTDAVDVAGNIQLRRATNNDTPVRLGFVGNTASKTEAAATGLARTITSPVISPSYNDTIVQPAGGWDSLANALRRRIQELPAYRSGAPKGKIRALLSFKAGKLSEVLSIKGFDDALHKEIKQFLLQWPSWKWGSREGVTEVVFEL